MNKLTIFVIHYEHFVKFEETLETRFFNSMHKFYEEKPLKLS